jgi:hypothetical protein
MNIRFKTGGEALLCPPALATYTSRPWCPLILTHVEWASFGRYESSSARRRPPTTVSRRQRRRVLIRVICDEMICRLRQVTGVMWRDRGRRLAGGSAGAVGTKSIHHRGRGLSRGFHRDDWRLGTRSRFAAGTNLPRPWGRSEVPNALTSGRVRSMLGLESPGRAGRRVQPATAPVRRPDPSLYE